MQSAQSIRCDDCYRTQKPRDVQCIIFLKKASIHIHKNNASEPAPATPGSSSSSPPPPRPTAPHGCNGHRRVVLDADASSTHARLHGCVAKNDDTTSKMSRPRGLYIFHRLVGRCAEHAAASSTYLPMLVLIPPMPSTLHAD